MLFELDALEPSTTVSAQVCVVGAGPAGMSLALALARAGVSVVLVESGRRSFDASIQALAEPARFDEQRHAPMSIATRRQLGGASSIWGGRCVPLDAVDFERRPGRGDAVWPLDYESLARYHAQASAYCVCGGDSFDVRGALGEREPIVPGFSDDVVLASSLERWSLPTDFGKVYHDEVCDSSSLSLYLGFSVCGLEGAPGAVARVQARSLCGKSLYVVADKVVIAAGGLESTRLLLNFSEGESALVPRSPALGRYYMGHISGKIAEVQFSTPPKQTVYGFERDAEGIYCRRRFTLSAKFQREHALLNCAMWLDNPPLPDASHRNGVLSLAYLALTFPVLSRFLASAAIRLSLTEHPQRSSRWRHVLNVIADLPAAIGFAVPFVFRRYVAVRRVPGFFLRSGRNRYALHYHSEQAPCFDSRVWLADERDALGLRRLNIDFRYQECDVQTVLAAHAALDRQLRAQGCGELRYVVDDPAAAVMAQAKDGYHQIGTTRMSSDPAEGVVDGDCRVHGMTNLYVLSSSVFPTSGQANPTYSLVALALRLADHLKSALPEQAAC